MLASIKSSNMPIALYHQDADKRVRIITQLQQYLEATALPAAADLISPDWFQRITESATKDYDYRYGGFGHMPKFPPHGVLAQASWPMPS